MEVDTDCYSLWGGSAGARMSAWLGSYALQLLEAMICSARVQSLCSTQDIPTTRKMTRLPMHVWGENDGIASWRTMESRLNNLNDLDIDTEFHKYPNLRHGFGLGTNTVAEGWLDDCSYILGKNK